MTFEEAKKIFLDRGLVEVEGGVIFDGEKWREACYAISKWLKQEPCNDAISRQAAQAKIKSICNEYRLSYEDGERKPATGGSAYALGHAFDDLPPVTPQHTDAEIQKMQELEQAEIEKAYELGKAEQPKTGHWIDRFPAKECKCSVCDFLICISNGSYVDMVDQMKYCPNCGAKMIELQESEDK